MVANIIQQSAAGGELSPELWGRSDLAKYHSGAAVLRNMYVDYRGGFFNRPGTQFIGPCNGLGADDPPIQLPFRFNDEQSYVLEFVNNTMRIIERGLYQTETPTAITSASRGANTTVTSAGHGLIVGDLVTIAGVAGMVRPNGISGLNGRYFRVAQVVGNVIRLGDPYGFVFNSSLWSAYVSGGTIAKIREVTTPWDNDILYQLKFVQQGDVMTVVHGQTPVYNIKRHLTNPQWTIEQENFAAVLFPPTGVAATHKGANFPIEVYSYVVTTIDLSTQDESAASGVAVTSGGPLNPDATDGDDVAIVKITWNAVAGENRAYRIYKGQVVPYFSGFTDLGVLYGLIGETQDVKYYDRNYEPDFTSTPPKVDNPFSNGRIATVTVDEPGFGYLNPVAVLTDPAGSGATITVQRNAQGSITGFVVADPGQGYGVPVLTVIENPYIPGVGATFDFNDTWILQDDGTYIPDPAGITVLTGGTGYHAAIVTMTPAGCSGSGPFVNGTAYITMNNGVVTGLRFDDTYAPANVGTDSTSCTLTFAIADQNPGLSPITAATGEVTLGDQINPGAVTYFQQRKAYAGGDQRPRQFELTRPGLFTNFDSSDPPQADDAIIGSVVGPYVNELLWLVPVNNGLVAGTSSGAYLISSGSGGQGAEAISPSNATADPQAINGAAPLQPLVIGNDILYVQARGSAIRSLAFDFYVNSLAGVDVSALSAHLLVNEEIAQWAWCEEPLHIAWLVRTDGILLSLTYIKEQQVYGWSRHDTQGKFVSVCSIPEGREDTLYCVVRRELNGRWFYFSERLTTRNLGGDMATGIPTNVENAWFVDAGLRYPLGEPPATLLPGSYYPPGEIANPSIIVGGTGYPNSPVAVVVDDAGTGSGATVLVTASGGVITSVSVVTAGTLYQQPRIVIEGSGYGAEFHLDVLNRQAFKVDVPLIEGYVAVGDVLRVGGGMGVVIQRVDSTNFVCNMIRPILTTVPNGTAGQLPPVLALPGEWTMTTPVSTIGGLDHLTGKLVTGLVDGSLLDPQVIVDGCITLDYPATSAVIGRGYTAQFQALPLDAGEPTIQGRPKQMPALVIRCMDTRGIMAGPNFDALVEIKQRFNELMGQPIDLQTGGAYVIPASDMPTNLPTARVPLGYQDLGVVLAGGWDDKGQICIQQSYPLPCGVLATVVDVNVADP